MIAQQFFSLVLVAIIYYRAVIAGENDKRIVAYAQFIKCLHDLAYTPIELYNGVSAQSHCRFPSETWVRETGNMYIVCGEVNKEGLTVVFSYEMSGMESDRIGNVFVFPQGVPTTFHISDTADAIDYGLVMSMFGSRL